MENEKQSENKNRGRLHLHSFLKPLLFTLVLLFVMSSGVLGYTLGKRASSSGELIDTIVLSPGDTLSRSNVNHYLTGKVIYPDGTPCAFAEVRLGEDSADETDEQGKFFFVGLQSGEYDLSVTDESGVLTSVTRLLLDFSKGQTATADFTVPGEAGLFMPENTRMLDMTMVVEGNVLTVEEGSSFLVTTDGEIVDFVGGKLNVSPDSVAVTPTGSIITEEGYVLLLSKETVLTPTGGNEAVNTEAQVIPEVEVQEDGSAVTGDGVLITADDNIVTPDGETSTPDNSVIIVDGETAEEITELPQETTPSQGDASGSADEPVSSAPESEPESEPESATEDNAENSTEDNAENNAVESEAAAEQDSTLALVDLESGREWAQMSLINLFKNSMDTQTVNGEEYQIIAPGTSGTYEFRLVNENDFAIEYTIAIAEETLDLPIGYSIFDKSSNYCYMNKAKPAINTSGRQMSACTSTITLAANSQKDYRIEWFWDYEARYKKAATNQLETEIASAENVEDRLYTISIRVNASEVIVEEEEFTGDEDTRYPGIR